MYCPSCGQERISHETSFCSRCGFLLTGTAELLQSGGVVPSVRPLPLNKSLSPKNRGMKQGLFLFLLTFLIVPIIAIITVANDADPWVLVVASILLAVGGLLRMVYALMFESSIPGVPTLEENILAAAKRKPIHGSHVNSLPPQQTMPPSVYTAPITGKWRNTDDLQPTSVTDGTTKLLSEDEMDQ